MRIRALVPIADGSEEIEAVCIIDTLRRADIEVTVARAGDTPGTEEQPQGKYPQEQQPQKLQVTASRGVILQAETTMDRCRDQEFDAIVLPGGMPGAEHLRDDAVLTEMLKEQRAHGRLVAAICASPVVVLAHHGLIGDLRATCYPGFMDRLPAASRSGERVVRMANLITSRGPGTALEFSLEIVDFLCGRETREELAGQMLIPEQP
ncbi:DJ-1 family protein [bacterium DOLJORAL78_65_58]|nr:MAG: DJ-1 family protein [bacterium DOLZORAL124_64_63]PIE75534.1 MAG: DJ-1 family protein [bacterium DOLJORAL78_65_58]